MSSPSLPITSSTKTSAASSKCLSFLPPRYQLFWSLYGKEAIAVMLGLFEVGLLSWSARVYSSPPSPQDNPSVAGVYIFRATAEAIALTMALGMGKYSRVGSTPLAFEWQPSNTIDSITLPLLVIIVGCIAIPNLWWSKIRARMPLLVLSFLVLFVGCLFLLWFLCNRKKVKKHGPTTLTFNNYARYFAISYEVFGALFDLVVVIVAETATASVLTLLIELLRTVWEIWQDAAHMKACYSFNRLYLPIDSIALLKNLNTNRKEALMSNAKIDGVVLETPARMTSRGLSDAIVKCIDALNTGPISGGYWYEALGGAKRDSRFVAQLAVRPTIDSDLAWMDSKEVTINFPTKGVQLSVRLEDGLYGYSSKIKGVDCDGRISVASIWRERDSSRPSLPIQYGANPINLQASASASTSSSNSPPAVIATSPNPPSLYAAAQPPPPYVPSVSTHSSIGMTSTTSQSNTSSSSLMDRVEQLEKILGLIGTAAESATALGDLFARSNDASSQPHNNVHDTVASAPIPSRMDAIESAIGLTGSANSTLSVRISEIEQQVALVDQCEIQLFGQVEKKKSLERRVASMEEKLDIHRDGPLLERIAEMQEALA